MRHAPAYPVHRATAAGTWSGIEPALITAIAQALSGGGKSIELTVLCRGRSRRRCAYGYNFSAGSPPADILVAEFTSIYTSISRKTRHASPSLHPLPHAGDRGPRLWLIRDVPVKYSAICRRAGRPSNGSRSTSSLDRMSRCGISPNAILAIGAVVLQQVLDS